MRLIMTLLAPLLGWLAFFLFRMPFMKKSRRKHQIVMRLFRYAADYGSLKALSVYGHLLFFRGDGETNRVQGAIYLERAAEKGDVRAAYQMGKIYEEGYQNFPVSHKKAVAFYRQAAENGHLLAISKMWQISSQGLLGQPVSEAEAARWDVQRDRPS